MNGTKFQDRRMLIDLCVGGGQVTDVVEERWGAIKQLGVVGQGSDRLHASFASVAKCTALTEDLFIFKSIDQPPEGLVRRMVEATREGGEEVQEELRCFGPLVGQVLGEEVEDGGLTVEGFLGEEIDPACFKGKRWACRNVFEPIDVLFGRLRTVEPASSPSAPFENGPIQVPEEGLYFLSPVERDLSSNPIRNSFSEEGLLEGRGLPVGPDEHDHFVERDIVFSQRVDGRCEARGCVHSILSVEEFHVSVKTLRETNFFGASGIVFGDNGVGEHERTGRETERGRDSVFGGVVPTGKVKEERGIRPAPLIDALIFVSHDHVVAVGGGEEVEEVKLHPTHVLKLVDEDVLISALGL
jgi:hypothetical protein